MRVKGLRVRGLQNVVGTIILVVITIGLAFAAGYWVHQYMATHEQSVSGTQTVLTIENQYYNATGQYFVVYVKNSGTQTVEVQHVYVKDPNGLVHAFVATYNTTLTGNYAYVLNFDGTTRTNTEIAPGETVMIKIPFTATAGAYTITVATNGGEASTTITV